MPDQANTNPRRQGDAKRNAQAGTRALRKIHPQHVQLDPLAAAYRIPSAIIFSGLSRSELYRRLTSGEILARKAGRAMLIDGDSLRRCIANFPVATFGKQKADTTT